MKFLLLAMLPLALAAPAVEIFIDEATAQPARVSSENIKVYAEPAFFDCIINCGTGGQFVPNCRTRADKHVSMVGRTAGCLDQIPWVGFASTAANPGKTNWRMANETACGGIDCE
ncbi:MAG: hypothetical protein Q9167_006023 [Letrouitia subvulpina]